ncbi:hypothetical protein Emag_002325 [Eimeria magna]
MDLKGAADAYVGCGVWGPQGGPLTCRGGPPASYSGHGRLFCMQQKSFFSVFLLGLFHWFFLFKPQQSRVQPSPRRSSNNKSSYNSSSSSNNSSSNHSNSNSSSSSSSRNNSSSNHSNSNSSSSSSSKSSSSSISRSSCCCCSCISQRRMFCVARAWGLRSGFSVVKGALQGPPQASCCLWGPLKKPSLRGPLLLSSRNASRGIYATAKEISRQRLWPCTARDSSSSSSSSSSNNSSNSSSNSSSSGSSARSYSGANCTMFAASPIAAAHQSPLHTPAAAAAVAPGGPAAAAADSKRLFSTRNIRGRLFYKRRPLQVPRLKPPNIRRYTSSSNNNSSSAGSWREKQQQQQQQQQQAVSCEVVCAASGSKALLTRKEFA